MSLLDAWHVLTGAKVAVPVQPAIATPIGLIPKPVGAAVSWRGTIGVQSNSWRCRNPSNLRPPSTWKPVGLAGIYDNPVNGRFCIFESEAYGWQALATRILQLVQQGKDTPREIINVWAPPAENNTGAYIAAVAGKLGIRADAVIDPRRLDVMTALGNAIRQHEGKGSDPAWDVQQQQAGLLAAGCEPYTGGMV